VISCLGLHWVNDLPSALRQIRQALKPDGLFLGAFFGGETLNELRIACSIAELEREGGVSPRVSPFAKMRDAGSLLSVAGFALPVVDVDTLTIRYASVTDLVDHLRVLGESNANINRRRSLHRDTALASAATYHSLFANEDGDGSEGGIPSISSTFQVLYVSGWSPHEQQQKPRQRGSATASFKDLEGISKKT